MKRMGALSGGQVCGPTVHLLPNSFCMLNWVAGAHAWHGQTTHVVNFFEMGFVILISLRPIALSTELSWVSR